jgi:cyclophilin family peptidyl-prolyl cis-trans isomerase
MANSGPNTNGSQVSVPNEISWLAISNLHWRVPALLQFFITLAPTPWLDGMFSNLFFSSTTDHSR